MKYAEWRKFYYEILQDFNFSEVEDIKAAQILNDILKPVETSLLKKAIAGRKVNIFGAGPSLEDIEAFPRGTKISADGATSFLLERGINPDVVVTDLDGKIEDLIKADREGSIVVIHAHGDNMEMLKRYAGKFKNCIGTTQSKPFGNLYNFGGFTDGDRAVFLAEHFKARKILLYGMDFGKVGRYSFSNNKIKRKKLIWGKRLITYLMQKGVEIDFR